jgi:serine/threonine protein kinase
MIGERVEQYQVQRKLGSGAMGSLYLALDTLLNRPVALKFVLSDFNNHPDIARRFLEEARVLASLNRSNIPILYGYFIWKDQGVMAMEYVDGETLEEMVRRRGPIPADVCVPLVKQALLGLAAAHRLGIVHRDLKPSNLMLNKEGTVKVVDFGIAKKIEGEVRLTATNTTVGTPMYMAPEQIMGKPVDSRTDIYSMGVVLYELLAGQVPFNADSIYEIQAAHVQKKPEPPTVHYQHIPRQVVDAVMKALQKEPASRFASAEDFIRALPELEPAHVFAATTVTQTEPTKQKESPAQLPVEPFPAAVTPGRKKSVRAQPPVAEASAADRQAPIDGQRRAPNKPLIAGLASSLALIVAIALWLVWKPPTKTEPVVAYQPPRTIQQEPKASTSDSGATSSSGEISPPAPPKPATGKTHPAETSGGSGSAPRDSVRRKTPPPPAAPETVAGQELSGDWQGAYFNTASQEKTLVQLSMHEANGRQISGILRFEAPDNTSGECDLNGSTYDAGKRQLQLVTGQCKPELPYLRIPTKFDNVDPTGKALSGRLWRRNDMVVQLSRR